MGAVCNDLHNFKVSNKWILIGGAVGILFQLYRAGIYGVWLAAIGFLLPIILLAVLYLFKVIGAGDVKLFAVIGCNLGIQTGVSCICYSFIAGAIISIIFMIIHKNFFQRMQGFIQYIQACVITRKCVPYYASGKSESKGKMHFSIAILAGYISCFIASPITL